MSFTSPNGYAFVNAEMVVVNAIGGALAPHQLERFERDYRALFGAEFSVPVFDGTSVWVGGTYNPDTGEFFPPIEPEPEPQPEPLPEPQLEPES
jgi:hypothetical protein